MKKKTGAIPKVKTCHMFIRPDLHAEIKRLAAKEGKKLRFYTNEFMEWAIGYKNFLDSQSTK